VMLRPMPIEVWTEESTIVNPPPCDDKDDLCVGDEPMHPSPVDTLESGRAQKSAADLKPDPTATDDDNAELCVEDVPLGLSAPSVMDAGPGKPEERSSSVDEDRDIDTTETSSRLDANVDLSTETSKWNGVDVDVAEPSSTLVNGYPDDDVRM